MYHVLPTITKSSPTFEFAEEVSFEKVGKIEVLNVCMLVGGASEYIHTCIHTIHAYIHTYIHTYIHSYIHTYLTNSKCD